METRTQLIQRNRSYARRAWGHIPGPSLHALEELTRKYRLSVALGDIQYIEQRWYVTHAGLLRLAERTHCSGIHVRPVREFCNPSAGRWVYKATVYKSSRSRGFVGYGDADPSNVSPLVRGAEMRIAETRALNRALRKAYGIGLCETGWLLLAGWRHLNPAMLAVGPSSPSPIGLGLPCGRSQPAPGASASVSVPFHPFARGGRRAGLSFSPSPSTRPNLIPSPRTNARKHLTLLSA